jgi:hypothetical protein
MKHKISSIIILVIFPTWLLAQEPGSGYLNVDAGSLIYFGEFENSDYIRKDISSYNYYYDDYNGSFSSTLYVNYASIKYQYFFMRRLSFRTGLRYSHLVSSIGKYQDFYNNTDFFYFYLSQNGTETEFVKLKEIGYSADYIGIPAEIMFKLFDKKYFYLYLEGGVDLGLLVNKTNKVKFENSAMNGYSNAVMDKFSKPGKLNSNAYCGMGMHIGTPNKVSLNFELSVPAFLLTSKSSSFTTTGSNAGIGLQVSLQIPLLKKQE